jgi:tetratricopeptide (TPR) repeat protein
MNELVQEVFMVLVSLATPLEGNCVGDVCREVGVQHAEFQSSLNETYFASIIDNGNSYDLEIVELAKEFFRQKKKRAPSADIERFENIAFKVDKLSAERNEIERNYKSDRVADAYRSEYAKAAKIATIKRDNKSAREYFELALLEEPLNAALHERYASFLLRSLGRADQAYDYAHRATELDAKSGDAWLTLALIQYGLNSLEDGDFSIEQARKNGKPESLCALRQGIARYHHVQKDPEDKSAMKLLLEAQSLISRSSRVGDPKDFYYAKNISTAEKYAVLVNSLIKKVRKISLKVKDRDEV